MAEATGLRSNALNYPVYGAPFGIVFPILDADGDLVTAAANLDSEVSKNGDGMADCTNEATEIATSSGMYYLLLTGTELTADVVTGITKTSTSGAKTTSWALYPRKLVTVRSGTAAGGAAGYITLDASASAIDDYYNGMVCIATLDSAVEVRVITDYTGSNKQAAVTPDWNTTPDSDDTFIIKLPEGVQIPTVNVTLWKGAVAPDMTGDAYARLGAPVGASISADLQTIDGNVDSILTDTGTTLDTLIKDIPTVAEFEARTIAAADYTIVGDLGVVQTGDAYAIVNNGTYGNSALETLVNDLESRIGTPSDLGGGATIAANLVVIEGQTDDIGAAGAGLSAIPWNAAWDAEVQSEATDALNAYDPPTNAELEARTLVAASYFDPAADTVAHVTLVDTTTTNTDMRGTDGAELAGAAAAAVVGLAATGEAAAAVATLNDITVADIIAGITEGTLDLQEILRIILAALAGKASGGGTATIKFRDQADTKDRITATVDVDGNRTLVVVDGS